MKKKKEEKKQEEPIDEQTPMSNEQMVSYIYELSKTHTWRAIQRYNMLKDAEVISSLAILDPFKEPTQVARTQGIRIGLYYIEQLVKQESDRRKRLQAELDGNG
jgi:hypothetical protein